MAAATTIPAKGSKEGRDGPSTGKGAGAPGQLGHAGMAGSPGQSNDGHAGQAGPCASQMEKLWVTSQVPRFTASVAQGGMKKGIMRPDQKLEPPCQRSDTAANARRDCANKCKHRQ